VYLQARLEVLISRIKRRGREFERKIDPAYLDGLSRAYNDFFFHYSETPLLVINTSDIDFVNNDADLEHLLTIIDKTRHGTQHYIPLASKRP
jgi:deoxyadenosine/deoxycytidine kinase